MPRSVTLVAMLAAASLSAQTAEPSSAPPARVIVQVLGPDLAPLRDVTAWFEAPNRQSHRIVASGRTDADGVVSFERIPQASYNLRLRGPGVPLGWAHHKFAVNCPIVDRLVVRMPRLGSIRGQLTHSETGEPMVHRLVELTSRSGGPSQLCTVQTDHEGRYRFDMVGPGHYVVVPDRARLRGMVGFVKVQPGSAATHDLRGIVAPTVHGVVRDSNGVPVAGATVECKDRVSWMLSGSPIPATTDTTGRFSLRLTPPTPTGVRVTADGFESTTYPLEQFKDAGSEGWLITLPRQAHPPNPDKSTRYHPPSDPAHLRSLEIVDQDGKPVTGATVSPSAEFDKKLSARRTMRRVGTRFDTRFRPSQPYRNDPRAHVRRADESLRTNREGRVQVTTEPNQAYDILVDHPDFAIQSFAFPRGIPATESPSRLILSRGGTIRGTIRDLTARSHCHLQVEIRSADGMVRRVPELKFDGHFEEQRLPPGEYAVRVHLADATRSTDEHGDYDRGIPPRKIPVIYGRGLVPPNHERRPWPDRLHRVTVRSGVTHTLVVEPDPVTILEGVVEDAHGPVPGAVVFQPPGPDGFDPPEFGPHGPPVAQKPRATTDNRGRFVFWVAGPGRVELRVRTQLGAFASRFWRWHLGAPTKPPNRKVVRLRIGHGSIVGRLSLGKREGYATVHLFPADTADCDAFYGGPLLGVLPYADKLPYFTRKANGDRPFRFDNLDAGAYVLRVRNDKNQTVTQRVIDLELDDSVDLGPVKEDPSTEVRVRGDLYPSRHITIYRHLPDDPPHRRRAHISTHRLRPANANEDHSASLATMTTRLAPGSYEAVLAPKLILPFQVSRSGKVEPEELSANIGGVEGKIPEVDLRHFQCRVRLQREDGGPSLETTLRPDGTFWRDGLTPGRYRVLLDRIGGSPYTGQLESMTRAPEPTPLFVGSRPWPHTQSIRIVRGKRIALQLESPPTDWITGLVTANGRPVADAVVAASPVAAPDRELVRTGKDGRFRLAIAGPGRWVVSAEAKGRTATRHLERGASPTTREHPTHLLLPLTQPPRWR